MFVGAKKSRVWAVMDRNRDKVAAEIKDFGPCPELDVQNGVAFPRTGFFKSPNANG